MKAYINFLQDLSDGIFISNSKYGTKIGLKKRNGIQLIFWLFIYYTGINIFAFGRIIRNGGIDNKLILVYISVFLLLYFIFVFPFLRQQNLSFPKIQEKPRKLRLYHRFELIGFILLVTSIIYAIYLTKQAS